MAEPELIEALRTKTGRLSRRQLDCFELSRADFIDEPGPGRPGPQPVELISMGGIKTKERISFEFGLTFRAVYRKEILNRIRKVGGEMEIPKEYGFAMPRMVYATLGFRRAVLDLTTREKIVNGPWTISQAGLAVIP